MVTARAALGLVLFLACGGACACTSASATGDDDEELAESTDALRVLAANERIGDLAFGETKTVAYGSSPLYRALRVQANAGDKLDVWVRGAGGTDDAVAWIVNARSTTLASGDDSDGMKDAHLTKTIVTAGEYWVVLRNKTRAAASFRVSLAARPQPEVGRDAPSCKVHLGGDTCGRGEIGEPGAQHESCCRSLEVPGYADPAQPGKKVYLDKYEVTAGRVRAFVDAITKQYHRPDLKAWAGAHPPPAWNASWAQFLASDTDADSIALPNQPAGTTGNVGTSYAFGGALYVYVHGHNCYQGAGSYGFPTYWYPDDVMTNQNGGLPRAATKADLDVKAMTCIPNAVLAAFCAWDGGQLATESVLDAVTANGTRLAPSDPTKVNVSSDSASTSQVYYYPSFGPNVTHEGVSRIAAPGRVAADVVSIDGGEPWMDLRGNLNEVALAKAGGFTLLYQGIGYSSARALNNPQALKLPEYKAGYAGGRCMRFR
ncbi:MAG: Tryptophan synthase alpha chain [Labilithrix sp.]|nr:Tryptophan synthase alpha chain [Labilithrix sp.]